MGSLQRENPWEAVEDESGTQVEELEQVEQVEDPSGGPVFI